MATSALLVVLPVAFQLWDAVGWLGQALFSVRMLHQWLLSERRKRVSIPKPFWWYSLGGALCLLVYQLHREDPVFLVGVIVTIAIYVRNLVLSRRPREVGSGASPLVAAVLGVGAFAMLAVVFAQTGVRTLEFDQPVGWLVLGFSAQALWSSRFVVQWWVSERLGQSVLPRSFFVVSLVGAIGLFAYALYREDWVMVFAYAFNPIPYARNLVLLMRERRAEA